MHILNMVSILRINYPINQIIIDLMVSQPKYLTMEQSSKYAAFTFQDMTSTEKNTLLTTLQNTLINWT